MKVAIVGSRQYYDWGVIRDFVNALPADSVVVSGGAPGVDETAEFYARKRGLKCLIIPADWKKHGKGAGFLRNGQIVEAADIVVAFWNERSRGTQDTMTKARLAGKLRKVYGRMGDLLEVLGAPVAA